MTWQDITDMVAGVVVRTFTTSVLYTPVTGSPVTINAVFDAAFVEVVMTDDGPVQSVGPRLFIQLSLLAAKPRKGDKVTIGSTVYAVREFQPDGEAGAALPLQLA